MDNKLNDNNRKTILACRYCPMCRHVCSSEFISYKESDTPRGRAILLYNIYEGGKHYDHDTVDSIYNCFLCGCCLSWCQGYEEGGYNIPELIKFARRDIVCQGLEPQAIKDLKEAIIEKGNIYGINKSDSVTYNIDEKQAEVLYYLGADINFKDKEIAKSTINILKKSGIDFTILEDEPDSGKILDLLGYRQDAQKLATVLYNRIKNTGCKLIITSDPLAYDAFKNDYSEYGLKFLPEIEVKHISEFLCNLAERKKIKFKNSSGRVAVVDSEYIGRYNQIFDAPRKLVKMVPGTELVELQWSKNEMLATGESAFYFSNPDKNVGKELGKKLLKLANDIKVDTLITLSAVANNNIKEVISKKIIVLDIAEFIKSNIYN